MKSIISKISIFIFILLSNSVFAHTSHYQNFKKIEMEIFKDGKVIGFNNYFFEKKGGLLIVKNKIEFKVYLLGIEVFNLEGHGIEIHVS